LQPAPLGGKCQIVLSPKADQHAGEIVDGEVMLRPLRVHHQALFGERYPDSLTVARLRLNTLGKVPTW
jgi:hypothetical protein